MIRNLPELLIAMAVALLLVLVAGMIACAGSSDVRRPTPEAYCFRLSSDIGGAESFYAEICTRRQATCVALSTGFGALATYVHPGAVTGCSAIEAPDDG